MNKEDYLEKVRWPHVSWLTSDCCWRRPWRSRGRRERYILATKMSTSTCERQSTERGALESWKSEAS